MNNRDLDTIDTAYAPEYVHRGPDGHGFDRARARDIAAMLLTASQDRRARVVEQIAEGNIVVTRWESRGTQTGPLFGRPATGQPFTAHGVVISRIEGGLIVEDWELVHLVDEPTIPFPEALDED